MIGPSGHGFFYAPRLRAWATAYVLPVQGLSDKVLAAFTPMVLLSRRVAWTTVGWCVASWGIWAAFLAHSFCAQPSGPRWTMK